MDRVNEILDDGGLVCPLFLLLFSYSHILRNCSEPEYVLAYQPVFSVASFSERANQKLHDHNLALILEVGYN